MTKICEVHVDKSLVFRVEFCGPLFYLVVFFSFGHCIVCPSIYSFLLPLWYLLVIILPVLLFTASNYSCCIFWSLYYLSFYLQLLITPWYLLVIILHVLLITASYYPCGIFWHYITCPSIYSFLLPVWYLLVIILHVLLFTASY